MHKYPRLGGNAIASSQDYTPTNLAGESVHFCHCITEIIMLCIYINPILSKSMTLILPSLI